MSGGSGGAATGGGRGDAAAGALVVIGDVLLDRDVDGSVTRLAPDAPVPVLDQRRETPRPGGAGLAAVLAAADGRPVTLVTALADDDGGRLLAELLSAAGVELIDLGLAGTTVEKIRLRAGDRPLLRLDRGSGGAVGPVTAAARAAIGWADAVLVSDYGRGVAAGAGLRDVLAERAADGLPIVWDPHPRGAEPVPGIALATPNAAEASAFAGDDVHAGEPLSAATSRAGELRRRWRARAVLRHARGAGRAARRWRRGAARAAGAAGGERRPVRRRRSLAATAAGCLADGGDAFAAVEAAVAAASRFVADGGAGGFTPAVGTGGVTAGAGGLAPGTADGDAEALAAAVRARGGTVVATGGCFDLLHGGHLRTLTAARALGDCLIVCLNSDASVRALKGPDRPVVKERERAALLRALACVDAVAIFTEATPVALLERLQPDVWVKGGDYDGRALPEADALARWGGRVVLVPHHAGLSTTNLIEEAANVARR